MLKNNQGDRRKATQILYLDIDGTVRHGYDELGYFVNKSSDVKVFDEVPDLLLKYKNLGWRIAGITNQGGIALGYLTHKDCSDAFAETMRQCNQLFDYIQICDHHPDAINPEMARCWCRKPRIGGIVLAHNALRAKYPTEKYPAYLHLMVGDRPEDQECASNANIDFMIANEWRQGKHLVTLI